jgi:hypothetical protein
MDFRKFRTGDGVDRGVVGAVGEEGDAAAFHQLVLQRLDRLENKLDELLSSKAAKAWYDTDEVAELTGRKPYTVREWCRKGQVKAVKAPNGRGWLVGHEELTRLRTLGPLPAPKHEPESVPDR